VALGLINLASIPLAWFDFARYGIARGAQCPDMIIIIDNRLFDKQGV